MILGNGFPFHSLGLFVFARDGDSIEINFRLGALEIKTCYCFVLFRNGSLKIYLGSEMLLLPPATGDDGGFSSLLL